MKSTAMKSKLGRFSPTITTMIRMDHTHVMSAFHQYRPDSPPEIKRSLVNLICQALTIHATLEEEIFYPALVVLETNGEDEPVLDKSRPEHDEMRALISQLQSSSPGDDGFDDTFYLLMQTVIHHVADEETVLLPKAERNMAIDHLKEMGTRMTKRRMELLKPHVAEIARDTARGYSRSGAIWLVGAVLGLGFLAAKI